jgi:hypothetical protein
LPRRGQSKDTSFAVAEDADPFAIDPGLFAQKPPGSDGIADEITPFEERCDLVLVRWQLGFVGIFAT